MSMQSSSGKVRTTYEFIKAHRRTFSVQALCRVLDLAPSGYYAWLKQPLSNRALEDIRLLRLIRASFVASQGIYGAPRVFLDLREADDYIDRISNRSIAQSLNRSITQSKCPMTQSSIAQ
jgi:putative transposase